MANNIFIYLFLIVAINCNAQFFDIQMLHPSMQRQIGKPAIIKPGQELPYFTMFYEDDAIIEVQVIRKKDNLVIHNEEIFLEKYKLLKFYLPVTIEIDGIYRIDFIIPDNFYGRAYERYYFSVLDKRQLSRHYSILAHPDNDGKLRYIPDYKGNRIPDFSTVGYNRGEDEIPDIPVKIAVEPKEGDDTQRIQNAIDFVSSLEPDEYGFRGAVLLEKGVYELAQSLHIKRSGVILRGLGQGNFKDLLLDPANKYDLTDFMQSISGEDATILIATGKEKRTMINVSGSEGLIIDSLNYSEIIDRYVPVGSNYFHISHPERFKVGDKIELRRIGNEAWISELGMDAIPPRPDGGVTIQWSPFDLNFEHSIKAIEQNKIIINGNVMNAIESEWGGGLIYKYSDEGRIQNVGVENLRSISYWQPDEYGVDDTRHADQFIRFSNVKNSWISNVTMEHYYSIDGAVKVDRNCNQITIRHTSNLIAEKDYYSGFSYFLNVRNVESNVYVGRYGFRIEGQNTLVYSCYALNNRHSFAIGARVSGPNVFLNCKGDNSITWSEPHHRWAVGGLFDNVSDKISIMNRLYYGSGHGWAGANFVAWNTRGELICEQPPTAQNWAIGHNGKRERGPFIEYGSEGYWEHTDFPLRPESLYLKQLEDRMGSQALPKIDFQLISTKYFEDNIDIWCYPNPASYFTHFVFELEKDQQVIIRVYSITGKLLAIKDMGLKEKGRYEIFWETIDNNGVPLPNGIYIYRLIAGTKLSSNKLLIKRL